ncbi:histidinol-phosphate transaminase [Nocardioides montaniterrae]
MSGPRPLAHVAALPAYVPGRPPLSIEGLTSYKLSSNESPFGPLPGVLDAAVAAAAAMNRYPDMGSSLLYAALAGHLGVTEDELAIDTGSVAVLFHLLAAFCGPGDEVVHAWRSFEAYPIATTAAGATGVQVPLVDGRHDLDALRAAITERTRVVLLCTPNNPTGAALTHTEVAGFVADVPDDVVVVVDEAYAEYVRMADPVDGLALHRAHPNVVVLRTFSKAYGLAGLRVGYAVASPDVAHAIRSLVLPFGISSVAQAAAVASLEARAHLLERVEDVVAEREKVMAALADISWVAAEPQGNFVWLPLSAGTADFVAAAEGVALSVRGYAEDGVRVTIGEPEANARFVELVRSYAP